MKSSLGLFVLLVLGLGHLTAYQGSGPAARAHHTRLREAESLARTQVTGEVAIRVFAAPYKGRDGKTLTTMGIEVDPPLEFRDQDGAFTSQLEVEYTITDSRGRVRSGTAYEGPLTLTPDDYTRASRNGLRVLSRLELAPGRYQLRVSASSTMRSGTAVYDLVVPTLMAPLTMSGVFVSSTSVADGVTLPGKDAPDPIFPRTPTARREFAAGDTLLLFAEVYESGQRLQAGPTRGTPGDPYFVELGDHTTHVTVELRDRDGSILQTRAGQRWTGRVLPPGTHAFSTRLSLDAVPPGRYVLRLKARANIGEPDTASRDIPIRVR